MTTAVHPGTFDPFTPGHLDIADRAQRLFTRLVILIAANPGNSPRAIAAARADLIRDTLPQT